MGFAAGLQAGERLGQGILDAYNQSKEQLGIREAKALTAKEVQQREATPDEIGRARAEAQAMAAQDAEMFGLTPQEQVNYAPQMPVQGQRIGLSRYQVGQQMFDRAPTQAEIERVREYAMADVIADRDPARALQMRRELRNQEFEEKQRPLLLNQLEGAINLQGIQTEGAKAALISTQRALKQQTDFDTGFEEINKQKFEKPEERTSAILDLVERTRGPEARQQLQANYTTTELNTISLQAKKFDEGFRQSRAKGVIPALEWFDEQNTSFKLERDPKNQFRYIQVNNDGTRSVFADAKNERELGMIIDAKAKPGGFLELAKYDLDVLKADAAIEASKASAAKDRAMGSLYAGGGKASSTDALVKTAEGLVTKGTYKDLPTAIEALKKGSARDADAESWSKIEQDLVKNLATPEEINTQRMAFFVRRGYAPPAVKATLEAGVNPTTGKRLTKSDVDAYNATYPQTPVDPSTLRWLDSPEREARRQGLINQIPK